MPSAILPFTRSEKRRWALIIAHNIRASLPWWHVVERVKIGLVMDTIRTK